METLTVENARDGMTLAFFQNGGIHTLSKHADGSWYVGPKGGESFRHLPYSDFDLFRIVEESSEAFLGPLRRSQDVACAGKTLTASNARDGMIIRNIVSGMDRVLMAEGDGFRLNGNVVPFNPKWYPQWRIVSDNGPIVEAPPEVPIVEKERLNPNLLPEGHVDRPDSVLEGFRSLVDEMMDRMNALAGAHGLADNEDFDSVIGILLTMMQRLGDSTDLAEWTCPHCGTINPAGKLTCSECQSILGHTQPNEGIGESNAS